MINSMTGYGRGEYTEGDRRAVVEINSVNHRYLDTNIRMPRVILSLEEEVRKYVKEHVSRGKLDIYINYSSEANEDISIHVNEMLCSAYVKAFRELQEKYNLIDDISTSTIAKLPDIITVEKTIDDTEKVWHILKKALEEATRNFTAMRKKEGRILQGDLIEKGENISKLVASITKKSPQVVDQYKQKIQQRIAEALENVEIDSNRILTEVAIFADRTSLDEEITRLGSHIQQLKEILEEEGVVGRKLDFLIQEMNREANTIGSKSNDKEITGDVIQIKSEIEKMREQVQNIE